MFKSFLAITILLAIGTPFILRWYGTLRYGKDLHIESLSDVQQVANSLYDDVKEYVRAVVARFTKLSTSTFTGKIFTKDELKQYKYKYLSIVGEVYDVTKGERHYGKDGHYNFFTGLDGSRAYASGDFTEKGLVEDLSGLTPSDFDAIEGFRAMYAKDYVYLAYHEAVRKSEKVDNLMTIYKVMSYDYGLNGFTILGRLAGHFYDSKGEPTQNKADYLVMLNKAKSEKADEQKVLQAFPPCNAEFTGKFSRVWCSNKSGGITRDWVGVPRRLFKPGMKSFRCACIRTTGPPSSDPDSRSHKNRGRSG